LVALPPKSKAIVINGGGSDLFVLVFLLIKFDPYKLVILVANGGYL
jgi:hypothetical protein